MKSLFKKVFCAMTIIMLGLIQGCKVDDFNVIKDRSKTYKETKVYPALELPRDKRADKLGDLYEIP